MKIRHGFVSNSSSSSFVVARTHLTTAQLNDLIALCQDPVGKWDDYWEINITNNQVHGFTAMDNGSMDDGIYAWMVANGFPMDKITWDYEN